MLRYRVFTEELGRRRYANDHARVYSDRLDQVSRIILARLDGKDVGTLRFTLQKEAEFLDEDLPRFEEFLSKRSRELVALADRGVLLPEARGHQIYPKMWDFGFDMCRSLGVRHVLGVIDADNTRLVNFHAQGWNVLGYRREPPTRWQLIVKNL